MKIRIFAITLVLAACVLSGIAMPPASAANKNVAAVSVNMPTEADKTEILSARFLNMLNHNFVYDDDFNYIDEIINLSVISVLDSADSENPDYISESAVLSFVYDMYGIEVENTDCLNAEYPKRDGYIYIIPRGFTVYNHKNATVKINADGSYTVTTDVTVSAHDSSDETFKAVSLFVKNDASSLGYSLISSNIYESAVQI